MATTLITSLVDPEVFGAGVEAKLGDNVVFMAVADIENGLEGNPGDTISIPKYAYIGEADVVAENGEITPAELTETKVDKKVKKYAKAVQITDEAALSGYGDPVGEAEKQVAKSIDDAVDGDFVDELEGAVKVFGATEMTSDNIVDALALFGEDEAGQKALFVSASDMANLRKDDDYIKASDLGQDMILKGATGQIWGADLITTNRLNGNAYERSAYIVKPGGLSLVNKRGVFVELDRDALYQRSNIIAAAHCVPFLKDDSKVVRIRIFKSLEALTSGFESVAGETSGGTIIKISSAAPSGYKWAYKLGTSDVTPTWGTAVTGYTDWVSSATEIAGGSNTKASIVLVDADNKPVKYTNLALTKKA